jgi:hypothetical protein
MNSAFSGLIILLSTMFTFTSMDIAWGQSVYKVKRLRKCIEINANWSKSEWKDIDIINVSNVLGQRPSFLPEVKAKMMYDLENIYVIYRVSDRYVRCITKDINGPVWNDSCVEFFISPDTSLPFRYFNLEINCGGTPLMHYNIVPREEVKNIDIEDIKKIEIAHSLAQIVEPEINEPVTWTLEYRIPIDLFRKYSNITQPKPGTFWKANFYKIADKTSHPHYLTWSLVNSNKPDFHLPQFFGILNFE